MHHAILIVLVVLCVCRISLAEASGEEIWPDEGWPGASPEAAGLDRTGLDQARDYAQVGGGSGCVIRGGRLVYAWGDQKKRYDIKSSTKSIGLGTLGLAMADGKMKLADLASEYHPTLGTPPDENAATGWIGKITLLHLATQTAGFDKSGGYHAMLFEPGTKWSYTDAGPNWLAECITLVYRRDVAELLFERIFTPIGIGPADLTWRHNMYRPAEIEGIARREFGAGISANVDAMARIGLLYLRQGKWRDQQLLPADFVQMAGRTPEFLRELPVLKPEYADASQHYGALWWNNNDGTLSNVPRDAFWSWGLYDSLIVVIPSLDLVVVRAGERGFKEGFDGDYARLGPFLDPIVQAAKNAGDAPVPQR